MLFLETKPQGEAPSLETSLKPVTVTEGSEVNLVCKISGKPQPKVEWLKGGKPVKPDKRVITDYDGKTSTLKIKESTLDDEGEYKCVATNNLGSVFTSAEVLVNEKGETPTIKEKIKDVKVDIGEKATFKVVATGSPKPEAEWLKGDKVIEDKGRFVITEEVDSGVFQLTIDEVKPEDAGVYQCVVFNEVGEVTTKAELNVMKVEVVKQVTPVEEGTCLLVIYILPFLFCFTRVVASFFSTFEFILAKPKQVLFQK